MNRFFGFKKPQEEQDAVKPQPQGRYKSQSAVLGPSKSYQNAEEVDSDYSGDGNQNPWAKKIRLQTEELDLDQSHDFANRNQHQQSSAAISRSFSYSPVKMSIDLSTILKQREKEQRGKPLYVVSKSRSPPRKKSVELLKKKSAGAKYSPKGMGSLSNVAKIIGMQAQGASGGGISAEKAQKKNKSFLTNPFLAKKSFQDGGSDSTVNELLAKLQMADKKMNTIQTHIQEKEHMKFIQKGIVLGSSKRNKEGKKQISKSKVLDYNDPKQVKKAFQDALSVQKGKAKDTKPRVIKAEWTLASPARDKRKVSNLVSSTTSFASPLHKKSREKAALASPAKMNDPFSYMKRESSPVRSAHLKAAAQARKNLSMVSPGKKDPLKKRIPIKKPAATLNATDTKQAWKKPSLPSHLLYGVLADKKPTKVKRLKSTNMVGATTTKKTKLNNWNKSYMSTISRSPLRPRFKTPNKNSSSFLNRSQTSKFGAGKSGLYGQKSFGFRSQYGGIGLKNNLRGPNGQSVSSFGRHSDTRFGGSRLGLGSSTIGFKNNYLDNKRKDGQYNDALSTLHFAKSNAAKYNNYIRASLSPTRKSSLAQGPKSTATSRYGGSQFGGSTMKPSRSVVAIKTEFMPMGSAISMKRAADRLESGSKKKRLADLRPSEELYKFPTLGQIAKLGTDSPLSKLVKDSRARLGNKSSDLGAQSPGQKSSAYVGYDAAADEMERSFATEKVGGRYGELSLLDSPGKQGDDEVLFLNHELTGHNEKKRNFGQQRRSADFVSPDREQDVVTVSLNDASQSQFAQKAQKDYMNLNTSGLDQIVEEQNRSDAASGSPKSEEGQRGRDSRSTWQSIKSFFVAPTSKSTTNLATLKEESGEETIVNTFPPAQQTLLNSSSALNTVELTVPTSLAQAQGIKPTVLEPFSTKNPWHRSPQPVKKNNFTPSPGNGNDFDAKSSISGVSSVRNLDVTRKNHLVGAMDEDNEIGSVYGDYLDTEGPQVLKKQDRFDEDGTSLFELLTLSQQGIFGDRAPQGFQKLAIIERSDNSIMWLAESPQGQQVALKQIPKNLGVYSGLDGEAVAKGELEFYKLVFNHTLKSEILARPSRKIAAMPGIKHIIRLNEKIEDDSDIWLSFELGKRALSEWLCSKQKHVVNGDQIYSIQHQLFYLLLQQDPSSLVDLVSQICEFLKVLSQFRLVHANLRPKNILCEFDGNKSVLEDIQISGFSNCFKFDDLKKIRSQNPEYLPPEVLEFIQMRESDPFTPCDHLIQASYPWSIDVWSLGVILLEIASGYPVDISNKCKQMNLNGRSYLGKGIFGVEGQSIPKIIATQRKIVANIPGTLSKFETYGLAQDANFIDVLSKMLELDPKKRISPHGILSHKFCQN